MIEGNESPILQRLDDQISWYGAKSRLAQRLYQRTEVTGFLAACIIPIVAMLHIEVEMQRIIISALAVLIVMLRGLTQLNQHQAKWISYRSTCESLKHEKYLYLAMAGPYAFASSPTQLLAERVEGLVSQEHATWTNMQQAVAQAVHTTSIAKETRETVETDLDDVPLEEGVVNKVFNAIKAGKGASGWEVASTVAMDRDLVKRALIVLRKRGLVESNGIGLEGYYYLTSSGFKAREAMAGGS